MLKTLKSSVEDTKSKTDAEDDIDDKIRVLEEAIKYQREIVQNTSASIGIDLGNVSWSCPAISPDNKQALSENNNLILNDLDSFV